MLVVNIDEQNDVTHFPDLEVDVEVENEEEAGIPFSAYFISTGVPRD
jgi:hypothetical protein